MLELLSPAGNIEKLRTAINYGADACYMGLKDFSLRANAGNFSDSEMEEVRKIKINLFTMCKEKNYDKS